MLQSTLQSIVPRRSSSCAGHGQLLAPGTEYISILIQEGEEWLRKDYCLECWHMNKVQDKTESQWRGKIPAKNEKKRDVSTLSLFRKLYEEKAEDKVLYVLTLYLERRKELVRRSEIKDKKAKELHFYELLETGEIFGVLPCSLHPDDDQSLFAKLLARG